MKYDLDFQLVLGLALVITKTAVFINNQRFKFPET